MEKVGRSWFKTMFVMLMKHSVCQKLGQVNEELIVIYFNIEGNNDANVIVIMLMILKY